MAELGWKNVFLAGYGAFTLSRDRIEDIVNDMVGRGNVKEPEAKALIDQLSERAETERRTLTDLVREQFGATAKDLGVVTKDDLESVVKRIERLEKLLD